MTRLCVPAAFPTYTQVVGLVNGLMPTTPLQFPFNLNLPRLPLIPQPWLPTTLAPHLQLNNLALALQNLQQMTIMNAVYNVLKPLVFQALPSIPGLPGVNLLSLLNGDPSAFLGRININILNSIGLFPTLKWPELQQLGAFQFSVTQFMPNMSSFLFGLGNAVADVLSVTKLGALPAIPSPSMLLSMIRTGAINRLTGFADPITGAINRLSGLTLPSPLIPGWSIPEFEEFQNLMGAITTLSNFNLSRIADFVQGPLGLGLILPKLCITV